MERLTDKERGEIDGVLIGIQSSVSEQAMRIIWDAVQRMYRLEWEQAMDNLTHYDKHHVCVKFASERYGVTVFEDAPTRELFVTRLLQGDRVVATIETSRQTGETKEKPIDNSTDEASTNG